MHHVTLVMLGALSAVWFRKCKLPSLAQETFDHAKPPVIGDCCHSSEVDEDDAGDDRCRAEGRGTAAMPESL